METRIIRVDLYTGKVSEEKVSEDYINLGGRGLTSDIIFKEVDPKCDPLGPDNKLIIAPGLFGGTLIPNSGRLSIGAKSPLTGGIKESNVGGITGQMLSSHKIKAIIIEKASYSTVVYLEISDEGIYVREFEGDPFMGNYELTSMFHRKYREGIGILSIGPAGMRKRRAACINGLDIDKKPTRAAGRGGLGAVMGSKGLKAIVVIPSKNTSTKPSDSLKTAIKDFSKSILENPAVGLLHNLGTAGVMDMACELGSFPAHAFTKGKYDKFEDINGAKIVELQTKRKGKTGHRCMNGCIVACSNVFNDIEGKHITSALEYETLCLLGSNLEINDLDVLARMDRASDDTGIDSIESGGTFGVAMDEGKLKYGDCKRVLELIYETGRKSDDGDLYGNGVVHIAKEIGASRIPATMGQGHPGHDPRTLNPVGVTYATSPMGADHTAGLAFNPSKENAVELSRDSQIYAMLCDTFGLCIFISQTVEDITRLYNAFADTDMTLEDMNNWGLSLIRTEVLFNEKAGIPPVNERVSRIFREEPLPENGNIFDTSFKEMERIFE